MDGLNQMKNTFRANVDIHKLNTDFDYISLDESHPLYVNKNLGFKKVFTSDVYEQACNITAWQQLYDQIYPGQFSGGLSEVWLDGIQFCNESTNLALRQSCVICPGTIWFGLPRSPDGESYVCSSRITNTSMAVRQGGHEFELLTPDNQDIMGLAVMQSELEQYITLPNRKLNEQLASNAVLQVDTQKKDAYVLLMNQALQVAERHPHRIENPAVRKVIKDGLLTGMLDLLSDALPEEKVRYSQLNYRRIVSKARDFVLSRPNQPATILELCRYLHVSRRTLQNAFQRILNVCPLNYLKAIRLNAVRRELSSHYSHFNTVQDAAMAWGFWHMSQFAIDYQRLFHELPSETLANRGLLFKHLVNA